MYYYELVESLPTASEAAAIIDNITAKEKLIHSGFVTFVRGRCWSQTGSAGGNEMIEQHNLSGLGSNSNASNIDRERAYLFRVRAGTDSRGNPVYLRKWYHTCGSGPGGYTPSVAQLENTAGFSAANKSAIEAPIQTFLGLTAGGKTGSLVSKSGRPFTAGQGFVSHGFYEHHQLGDQWRSV